MIDICLTQEIDDPIPNVRTSERLQSFTFNKSNVGT